MERLREGGTERERSGHLSPPALARLATVLEISLSVVGSRKCISSFFPSGLGVVGCSHPSVASSLLIVSFRAAYCFANSLH